MTTSPIRQKIRNQIKPLIKPRKFMTGWGGELTFEQIADSLSPLMSRKLVRFGAYGQDIPDSIQTGLMRLWTRLVDNPELLAEDTIINAMWRTMAISKHTTLEKQNKKYLPFTDIEGDSDFDVDEFGISGLTNPSEWWRSGERWAVWASEVDFRLDITAAMETLAEEYEDDMKGLIALYILTTGVEPMETIATFGHPKSMVYERIKGIRDRLQRLLTEYEPIQPRTWQERLQAGEVEPYLQVVEHYEDRPLALFALYTLTTETKVRRFARDEKERKMIFYYRKKCLKRIKVAYGQAASF